MVTGKNVLDATVRPDKRHHHEAIRLTAGRAIGSPGELTIGLQKLASFSSRSIPPEIMWRWEMKEEYQRMN
jgi:hypothetical protein